MLSEIISCGDIAWIAGYKIYSLLPVVLTKDILAKRPDVPTTGFIGSCYKYYGLMYIAFSVSLVAVKAH
jgi:hypothetical protein